MLINEVLSGIASYPLERVCLASERFLLCVADSFLKTTILILAAWLVNSYLLRQGSPGARTLLWQFALIGAAYFFFMSFVAHGPVKPPNYQPLVANLPIIVDKTAASASQSKSEPKHKFKSARSLAAGTDASLTHLAVADNGSHSTSYEVIPPVNRYARDSYALGLAALCIATLWPIGVVVCVTRLLLEFVRLDALRRRSRPASQESVLGRTEVTQKPFLRKRRRIPVLVSSSVPVPLTYGSWDAVILLPTAAESWSEERVQCALVHEAAHIDQGDWSSQIKCSLYCALLWFHPMVWLAARGIRAESEITADKYVLYAGISAAGYAEHLLEIARGLASAKRRLQPQALAVPMARTMRLESRFQAILAAGSAKQPEFTYRLLLAMIASAGCLAYGMLHLRLTAQAAVSPWLLPAPPALPDGYDGASPFPVRTVVAASGASPTVTLPNGAVVTLTGVADLQQPARAWDVNGKPYASSWFLHGASAVEHPSPVTLRHGMKGRDFAVNVRYAAWQQPVATWDAPYNTPYSMNHAPTGPLRLLPSFIIAVQPNLDAMQAIAAHNPLPAVFVDKISRTDLYSEALDASVSSCTFRYAVAAGPWTEIVDCPKRAGKFYYQTPAGRVIFTLIPNAHAASPRAWPTKGYAVFMVTDTFASRLTPGPLFSFNGNYDREIVALDRAGHAIYDMRNNFVVGGDGKTVQQTAVPIGMLKRTDSFLFAARPYEWAEFRNVALQPR